MKLDLPNVTLLFVETRAHKITKRVIDDAMSKINFGDIVIYTDQRGLIPVEGARYFQVPDFPDKKTAGQFYYQFSMREVTTDFALMLEWDGGVKDVGMWRPEFLQYDYIGAPWKVRPQEIDKLDVGNGGFTLMSKKLGQYLADHQRECPVYTDWDVCRNKRPMLESLGFKWAPRDLATMFSWELTEKPEHVFGFHATFTWPWMLERDEVIARAKLMTETPYLISKMPDLLKKAPWLNDELKDELKAYHETHPAHSPAVRQPYNTMTPAQRARMNHILTQRRELFRSQMSKAGLKA